MLRTCTQIMPNLNYSVLYNNKCKLVQIYNYVQVDQLQKWLHFKFLTQKSSDTRNIKYDFTCINIGENMMAEMIDEAW